MSDQRWKTLVTKTVYSSPWMTVQLDDVQLPNGHIVNDYSVVNLPHVSVIVALTAANNVLLVKQYRHAVDKVLIELPAGTYNPQKESAKEAALRELQEETGYKAPDLTVLGTMYEYPTKQTHTVTMFLATNIVHEPLQNEEKEETEDIQVMEVPLTEAIAMAKKGEIQVAGSIAALLLAQEHLSASR